MGLFGGGNSSSSSTQTTTNVDGRVVGADGSINSSTSVVGSGNNITMTDQGAVQGALGLALKGIEGAQQLARESQAGSLDLVSGIFDQNAKQAATLTQAVVDLKTSDVRTLVIAGMAVIGLVGVTMFRKKAA